MYQFYSDGFFGYGEPGDFHYGSVWHFLPVLILIAAIFLVRKRKEKIAAWEHEGTLRFILGVAMIIVGLSYYWRVLYVGSGNPGETTLMTKLPLQLCEWSSIVTSFMIMSKNKTLFAISYFLCLTFGLVPLITPAVISSTGPGYYRYYEFWLEHCLPVFSVFYMIFVHGYRPHFGDMAKPLLVLVPLAVLSIYANQNIPGADYLYLNGTYGDTSLATVLPHGIGVHLVVYAVIGFSLFVLAYLPYLISDRRKAKNKPAG